MPEGNKPFVVNDRRKFTMDGDLRPDAVPAAREETNSSQTAPVSPEPVSPEPVSVTEDLSAAAPPEELLADLAPEMKSPTAEQIEQSRAAYEATAERLDTAIRAANPGADHPPAMNFEQLVQSVYMTSIMQLGGGTPEDQQPQLDLLGARQSIDMLGVLHAKTKGNLSAQEQRLLEGAVFDARLAFLEVTQALARSAAANAPLPNRPSIVR